MKDPVVRAAQEAFALRILNGTVGEHTKNASTVAKEWMTRCWQIDADRFQTEVSVHPSLNQRIDVLDRKAMCAYEFKVSGKNATAEFYKDIVKVILWNEEHERKIERLVFITEKEHGEPFLSAAMPKAFMKYVARGGIAVDVFYVTHS